MSNSFFTWDPSKYSVKVDSMDKDHQQLILLMNKLYERHNAAAPPVEISSHLKALGDYVVKHFKAEEDIFMNMPEYDKADIHKKIHEDLVQKYLGHVANFEKTKKLGPEFFQFLKIWLTAHIASVDMKYGEIYVSKNVKKAA